MNPPLIRSVSAGQSPALLRHVLACGVAIPMIYFGIQVAAAPFFPGYSFFTRDASSLGSPESTAPWIFNLGTLVLGVIEMAVAGAFILALPRARVGRGLAVLTGTALASGGIGSLNAYLHPLPDPQHTEGLLFVLGGGLVLLPALAAAVFWRMGVRRAAALTIAAYLALIPLVTGLLQRAFMWAGVDFPGYQSFLNGGHGLFQRIAAAVVFVPLAFIAHVLWQSSPRPR